MGHEAEHISNGTKKASRAHDNRSCGSVYLQREQDSGCQDHATGEEMLTMQRRVVEDEAHILLECQR